MAVARTVTLVANTVAQAALGKNVGRVRLTFISGTTPVFFRTDGTAPTVGGNDCQVLAPVVGATLEVAEESGIAASIGLISSGTPQVNVAEVLPAY